MSWLDSIVAVIFIASVGYVIYYIYLSVQGLLGVAKQSRPVPSSPLDACPSGKERSGQLCYNKCSKGGRTDYWNRIAATCWLKEVGVGIGVVKKLSGCGPGERDDGLLCWRN